MNDLPELSILSAVLTALLTAALTALRFFSARAYLAQSIKTSDHKRRR